jgi:hypothetical protein
MLRWSTRRTALLLRMADTICSGYHHCAWQGPPRLLNGGASAANAQGGVVQDGTHQQLLGQKGWLALTPATKILRRPKPPLSLAEEGKLALAPSPGWPLGQ